MNMNIHTSLGSLVSVLLVISAYGQEQSLTFEKKNYPNQPIEIALLELYGQEVKPGIAVKSGYEWLPGFTVQVKNKSSRIIKCVEIRLTTPTTVETGADFFLTLKMGQLPFGKRNGEEMTLSPGGTVILQPSLRAIEKAYSGNPNSRLPADLRGQHLLLFVECVFFDDDSAWMNGSYFKRQDDRTWNVDEQKISQNPKPVKETFRAIKTAVPLSAQLGCAVLSSFVLINCTADCIVNQPIFTAVFRCVRPINVGADLCVCPGAEDELPGPGQTHRSAPTLRRSSSSMGRTQLKTAVRKPNTAIQGSGMTDHAAMRIATMKLS